MTYKALRRDLTEATRKCDFCPRELTSLKAYVLQNIRTGEIAYAGPRCAKNNLKEGYELRNVPDFTKHSSPDGVEHTARVGGRGGGRQAGNVDNSRRNAYEYIILREEKLTSDLLCSDTNLSEYYNLIQSRDLTEEEIIDINRIEGQAPDNLKLITLQRCYSYLFWIRAAIAQLPNDKTNFLCDMVKKLCKDMKLTDRQKEATNNWLRKIKGIPLIK